MSITANLHQIPPYLIKPNPSLSRTAFPDSSLLSLADSIKRHGILQPLAVRLSEKGRYELIAGERRLRAAILLGMPTVPCIISDGTDLWEYLSVIENIQREKLTMFDEARAIKRLYEKNGRDISATAKLLSISESELRRKLRLCNLSRAEMQAIITLGISEHCAVLFLDIPSRLRYYTIKLCAEEACTVAETESVCREISSVDSLFPDDLEAFVKNHIKRLRTDTASKTPSAFEAPSRKTVILRDLRTFENSLGKLCTTLENAGCRTNIKTTIGEKCTTYIVTVHTT